MTLPRSRWLLCLVAVLVLIPVNADDSAPLSVTTAQPQRKTLARKIEQTGDIQAYEQTPLHARISGFVSKVHKDIGDEVKKGDVLAELAVPEMDEELNQKAALVKQSKAELTLAKKLHAAAIADTSSAQAKVKEAESSRERMAAELRRAESQLTRLTKSSSVVAQEVLDEAKLAQEGAKAGVAEVEARIKSAEALLLASRAREDKAAADIVVADSKQKVAEAEERRMAAMVGYAKLTAPFNGIVTVRRLDAGHFLQPTQGGKSEAAFVVASIDPVRVRLDIPENDAVLVGVGTKATISVNALNREEFKGKVTRTAWALDPKIRTLRVEVELENAKRRLRPGMYVTAILHGQRTDVLTIPVSAVLTQGEHSFCYLFEGGKAVRTAIKTGLRQGDLIEVAQRRPAAQEDDDWQPFTGREKVITSQVNSLSPGQAVKEASR